MKRVVTMALLAVFAVTQAQAQMKPKEGQGAKAAAAKRAAERAARRAGKAEKASAADAKMHKIATVIKSGLKGVKVSLSPSDKVTLKNNLLLDEKLTQLVESMDPKDAEINKRIIELISSSELTVGKEGVEAALKTIGTEDAKMVAKAQIRSLIDALAEARTWPDAKSVENLKATVDAISSSLQRGEGEIAAMEAGLNKLSKLTGKKVTAEEIREICKRG